MIEDWVRSKGKSFDKDQYAEFEKVYDNFGADERRAFVSHLWTCSERRQCGPHCQLKSLVQPKSTDYISGEPTERSLSDVLLSVMDVGHLKPLSHDMKVMLLENIKELPKATAEEQSSG